MMIESVSDPALNAISSLSVTDGSAKTSKGNTGGPNGGTHPAIASRFAARSAGVQARFGSR